MALLSTLTDNFNNNSLATKWYEYEGGGGLCTEQNTQLECALPASAVVGDYAGIENDTNTYDFTNSSALVQVVQVCDVGTDANTKLVIYDSAGSSTTNSVLWLVERGTMYAQFYALSIKNTVGSFTYNATTHKWWRIRDVSGRFYWDTSEDGLTWTNRYNVIPYSSMPKTAVNVNLEASVYKSETNPGTAIFDNFNLPTQQVTTTGIVSAEAFGTAQVGRDETVTTTGIASEEVFGTPSLLYEKLVYPEGFDAGEVGTPAVTVALLSSTAYDEVAKPTTAFGSVAKPTTTHTAVAKPTTAYSSEVL